MNRKLVSLLILVSMLVALFGVYSPAAASGQIKLSIGPLSVADTSVDRIINVPVMIDNAGTGKGIIAYQFNVAYDPTWLEVVPGSVADGDVLNTLGGMVIAGATPKYLNGLLKDVAYSVLGGTGSFQGNAKLASFNIKVRAGAPNGKYNLTLQGVVLSNPQGNSYPASDIQLINKWIQVGPGPDLKVTAISFAPIGTGQSFNVSVTITNQGGSISDPDTFDVTAVGATPAAQLDQALAPIAAGASQTFDMGVYTLDAGAQNATITVKIDEAGHTASAVYSPVSDTDGTDVDASFGAFLDLTTPDLVTFPSLVLGMNQVSSSLNVKCNTNYAVEVSNARGWKMAEWNGTAFVAGGRSLKNAMSITADGRTVSAGTPKLLVDGGVAGQNGNLGEDYAFTLKQQLEYADPMLPAGRSYHLIMEFLAYVTL